jgi:hypothetical protein
MNTLDHESSVSGVSSAGSDPMDDQGSDFVYEPIVIVEPELDADPSLFSDPLRDPQPQPSLLDDDVVSFQQLPSIGGWQAWLRSDDSTLFAVNIRADGDVDPLTMVALDALPARIEPIAMRAQAAGFEVITLHSGRYRRAVFSTSGSLRDHRRLGKRKLLALEKRYSLDLNADGSLGFEASQPKAASVERADSSVDRLCIPFSDAHHLALNCSDFLLS